MAGTVTYWIDLFTGSTWAEFRAANATVTGFRHSQRAAAKRVKPGDVLLCYLTGVMRWVGALEVLGPSQETRRIWKDDVFPVRFEVRPLIVMDPENGVPMDDLEGRVDFFKGPRDRGKFKGFVRRSPNRFARDEDGALILELLRRAQREPVARPVDPRKLARKPLYRVERLRGKERVQALVTVPEETEREATAAGESTPTPEFTPVSTTRHTEIQYHLLQLATEMGLDTWVARNDRSRTWKGQALGQMPRMLSTLPTQFNEATNRTIELIDVLWLRGNTIVAAFEVESTTSVYSGLLRMSDLLALQPNLDINIFLVAPDERRDKVEQEILRPTFSLREKPLHEICGFISFSKLLEKAEGIRKLGIAAALRPEFLTQTAEYFKPRP
jgi:hypothetical protein